MNADASVHARHYSQFSVYNVCLLTCTIMHGYVCVHVQVARHLDYCKSKTPLIDLHIPPQANNSNLSLYKVAS